MLEQLDLFQVTGHLAPSDRAAIRQARALLQAMPDRCFAGAWREALHDFIGARPGEERARARAAILDLHRASFRQVSGR